MASFIDRVRGSFTAEPDEGYVNFDTGEYDTVDGGYDYSDDYEDGYEDDYEEEQPSVLGGFLSGIGSSFSSSKNNKKSVRRNDYEEEDTYQRTPSRAKSKYAKPSYSRSSEPRQSYSRSSKRYDYDDGGYRSEPREDNVINISHANNQITAGKDSEIKMVYPRDLEDARVVSDYIQQDISCIINLEQIDRATSQRIADFISGVCDALDGSIERVSGHIFVIAPARVAITNHDVDERQQQQSRPQESDPRIFSWVQNAR